MPAEGRGRGGARASLGALLLAALLLAPAAGAHATLVIGSLAAEPDPPVPGAPMEVVLTLEDTLLTPVEKAHVRLELRAVDQGGPPVPESAIGSEAGSFLASVPDAASGQLAEGGAEGSYRGTLIAPPAGDYVLSVRDTTFFNEEAIANLPFRVGGAPNGEQAFVLPPTPVAPRSLSTWLIWLVGIPLMVGVIVTVIVLRKPAAEGDEREKPA